MVTPDRLGAAIARAYPPGTAAEGMMAATGIGGFFFRADDPAALGEWYRTHLGIAADFASPWRQEAGPTLLLPVGHDGAALPAGAGWMLNLRVDALAPMVEALRAAGVAVTTDPAWDTPETGRFARLHDPEGNPLELWEPPAG